MKTKSEKIKIPYGRKQVEISVPKENLKAILCPDLDGIFPDNSEDIIVQNALEHPIESVCLAELSKEKKRITIITSDHTRPVPSKITMPLLLSEVRTGNPNAEINILIATGFHRATTKQELVEKFGKDIVENENLIIHDSQSQSSLVRLSDLPSGGELWLNRYAVETDLLLAEGFIEPHFFAGFSGGRKSVLPGVAGYKTVLANHCSKFIASEFTRAGILENNPIHDDMIAAAKQAKLAFILNVALDEEKKIIKAFAGEAFRAHEAGCNWLKSRCRINRVSADIVITSNGGYPLDQNIYQAVKGMSAAEATCKEDGVIIMIAACNDGHGGESFYKQMAEARSPKTLLEQIIKVPQNETCPDQWEYQILARILSKYTVILVTDQCDPQMIRKMHMQHASTFDEALEKAFAIKGKNAEITVIPDGVSVIVG